MKKRKLQIAMVWMTLALCTGCSTAHTIPAASLAPSIEETASADSISSDESRSLELYAMDTVMNLTAYGSNAQKALEEASKEIQRLDRLLSISSDSGEILPINETKQGTVSADTKKLLERSLELSQMTDGLFDCTIEPVMEAWGFTTKNYRIPSADELHTLLGAVDYHQVNIENSVVSLPEAVSLDLGGIAKGFTSSRVMDIFRENGVSSGIISLGGNVQALGHKPDGSLWRVGIQDPKDQNSMFAVVEVADQAVITSGGYQRYFEENGTRYHHIIDPRTGYPADSGLTSVTIISDDGTLADALSTSLFIMGPEKASQFWKAHQSEFDAVMMKEDGTVIVTAGLADHCRITTGGNVEVVQ